MCGRFTLTAPTAADLEAALSRALGYAVLRSGAAEHRARFNIAPSNSTWLVTEPHGPIELGVWGFQSRPLARGGPAGPRPFNARIESASSRDLFRQSFASKRAIVIADGFFEWESVGGRKLPVWMSPNRADRPSASLLFFAALWSDPVIDPATRQSPDDPPGEKSFAILTQPANAGLAWLHHRMPCFISASQAAAWLDPTTPKATLMMAAQAFSPDLKATPVGAWANSVRNEGPQCLSPRDEDPGLASAKGRKPPAEARQGSLNFTLD